MSTPKSTVFESRLTTGIYILFLLFGYFCGSLRYKIGYVMIGLLLWKRLRMWWASRRPPETKEDEPIEEPEKVPHPDEDFETVRFLNVAFEKLWPNFSIFMEKTFKDKIQPKIRSKSKYLASFHFINANIGTKPPVVKSWRTRGDPERKRLIVELDISYDTKVKMNASIMDTKPIAGVKSVKVEGVLRMIFAPLMDDAPLFGSVTMYFPRRPEVSLEWTGFTNLLNIPGLKMLTEHELLNQVGQFIIAPHHFSHAMKPTFELSELQFLEPRNALRIQVIEAKNLVAKEKFTKPPKPYVVIHGGGTKARTRALRMNLNPKWNESFEILYCDLPDHEIEFNIVTGKDLDMNQKLGSCSIRADEVPERGCLDKWIDLEDVKSGQLHIKVQRLRLLSDPTQLEEVLKENEETRPERNNDIASAVIYAVFQKAKDLPVIPVKKGKLKPLAVLRVSVDESAKAEGTRIINREAIWNKRMSLLIRNPHTQEVKINIHNELNKPLGNATIPISRLLACREMTMGDWLPLESAEENSKIRVKMQMRILAPHTDCV